MTITLKSLSGKFHHPLNDEPLQFAFPHLSCPHAQSKLKDLAETILHFLSHFSVFFTPVACFIFFKKCILSLVFTTLFCYLYNLFLSYSSKLTCSTLPRANSSSRFFKKMNFFLAALGLCCCVWAFCICGARASLAVEHRL